MFLFVYYGTGFWWAIGAMFFSIIASTWTRSTFKKFDKIKSSQNLTGQQVAERILHSNQLTGQMGFETSVRVEQVSGQLTDHYSPKEKVLRLSEATYDSTSVAALGVAAHECGHAIQDAKGFVPNKIRGALFPLASIGSSAGIWLAFIGLMVIRGSRTGNPLGEFLFNFGIFFFLFAVLFYLVTLPVEIDASRRAIKILREENILTEEELSGAKKVLTAASMTYVAALASSVITLMRLLASRRR